MDSRELGLILGHQLFGLEDLHYGLWEKSLAVKLENLTRAQQRFNDYLIARLPPPADRRLLDVGCGTGRLLEQLLKKGYSADAVSPSAALTRAVRKRLQPHGRRDVRVFECPFEALDAQRLRRCYDIVLFSESFQFIRMDRALEQLERLLCAGGLAVICDMFSTEAWGDGGPGDGVIRGGHPLKKFYRLVERSPFVLVHDEDLTRQVSPTIRLVEELLRERIAPAVETAAMYVREHHPLAAWFARTLFGRRLRDARTRYLGGAYTQQTFERYKTYRFIVARLHA